MSTTDDKKQPEYVNTLYFKNGNGKDQKIDLPPTWKNEKGRNVTELPWGRLVQTPLEMLGQLREEKKNQEQSIDQEQKPEM